jgi:hypothetical protein
MDEYEWLVLGCRVLDEYWENRTYLFDPYDLLEACKKILEIHPDYGDLLNNINYTFHNFERLAERIGIEITR